MFDVDGPAGTTRRAATTTAKEHTMTTTHGAAKAIQRAVLQSQTIHPDWTPETHLAWLTNEGYDVAMLGVDPLPVIGRWLAENTASGEVDRVRAQAGPIAAVTHPADVPGDVRRAIEREFVRRLVRDLRSEEYNDQREFADSVVAFLEEDVLGEDVPDTRH